MTGPTATRTLTRRRVLGGLAGAAAVAASVAGCRLRAPRPVLEEPDLVSARVKPPVPADDPESPLWAQAKAAEVAVIGQVMVPPTKPAAAVASLRVRSLHDGTRIAFLLEWTDPAEDALSVKTTQFTDACGVLLGPPDAEPLVWMMGTAEAPVTLIHWRADWQRDLDAGFQDLEAAFPNAAFDFYPPLVGARHPLRLPDAYPTAARMWLPGWQTGNPLSQPLKESAVQKLAARGPGTVAPFATQDAVGRGRWRDRGWKVALAKPMASTDVGEAVLIAGQTYGIAFAVWSGGERDRGARKSVTRLGRLRVDA